MADGVELVWNEATELNDKPYCDNIGLSADFFKYYNQALAALQYFVPLVIISFAYISMAIKLYLDREAPARIPAATTGTLCGTRKRLVSDVKVK